MVSTHFQCLKNKSNQIFLISWCSPFLLEILGGKKENEGSMSGERLLGIEIIFTQLQCKISLRYILFVGARKEKETPQTSNSFLASISVQVNQLNIFFYATEHVTRKIHLVISRHLLGTLVLLILLVTKDKET